MLRLRQNKQLHMTSIQVCVAEKQFIQENIVIVTVDSIILSRRGA